ncbi:MAG: hypothetical protein HKN68_10725 [Saprospiraceae bacterium]|nr:hypothetical protein [Saprospiraceae bacterium]
MYKYCCFLLLSCFFLVSQNSFSTETKDAFSEIKKMRNIRVNGTVSVYDIESGCFVFNDTCSGVNYLLEGDASAYAGNGQTYCAVLRFVPPSNCGVSGEARIMNIRPGNCPGGGTFCR